MLHKKLDNQDNKWLVYSGIAFEMFAIIGIFTAIGFFVDKKLNTSPLFTLTLLFFGTAGAFYRVYKQLTK